MGLQTQSPLVSPPSAKADATRLAIPVKDPEAGTGKALVSAQVAVSSIAFSDALVQGRRSLVKVPCEKWVMAN